MALYSIQVSCDGKTSENPSDTLAELSQEARVYKINRVERMKYSEVSFLRMLLRHMEQEAFIISPLETKKKCN